MKCLIKSAHTANTCFILSVLNTCLLILLYPRATSKSQWSYAFSQEKCWVWWYTPVIILGRLRQEDLSPRLACLNKQTNTNFKMWCFRNVNLPIPSKSFKVLSLFLRKYFVYFILSQLKHMKFIKCKLQNLFCTVWGSNHDSQTH